MTQDDDEFSQTAIAQPEAGGAGKRPPKTPDYDVGYGKPPRHTRFQKGQGSPNPKGRPRKDKALQWVLEEALTRKVSVMVGGRVRRMNANELSVQQLLKQAMQGEEWAIKLLFTLNEKIAPFRDKQESAEEMEKKRALAAKLVGLLEEEAERKRDPSLRVTKYQTRPPGADDEPGEGSPPVAPA